jgi:hypothetical protein
VLPETVAGPLTTLYVITPVEFDVALTANGASPYVFPAIGANEIVGLSPATLKLVAAVPATKLAVAAWLTCNTTVPAPVIVTVLPAIVAGPLTTLYVIAPVEFDVALTANGASPYVLVPIGTNEIVGVPTPVTVRMKLCVPPACSASSTVTV